MTYEEVQQAIHDVAKLRMPDFPEDMEAAAKIEALEDHLLETARGRHILEEARIMLEDAYELIDDQWRDVAG